MAAILAALGSAAGAVGSAAGSVGSAVGSAAGSVGSALGSAAGSVGSALGSAAEAAAPFAGQVAKGLVESVLPGSSGGGGLLSSLGAGGGGGGGGGAGGAPPDNIVLGLVKSVLSPGKPSAGPPLNKARGGAGAPQRQIEVQQPVPQERMPLPSPFAGLGADDLFKLYLQQTGRG